MGNKILIITTLLILTELNNFSQYYPVSLIPDSLKENANCIIRDYTTRIELLSVNSLVEKNKEVFTVLNKSGEDKAWLIIYYDKNSNVKLEQITIYDGNGKKIRKVKPSEINDAPAFPNFILFAEERAKFYKPEFAEYPYTVEYEYEINSTNTISYADWRPVNDYNLSAEHASLSLSYPDGIKVNKKEINMPVKSSSKREGNKWIETWDLKNIKAIEDEPFDQSISERTSAVYLMPEELIYDEFKGKVTNWEEYGRWVFQLYKGRNELSDVEQQKVLSILKNKSDTLEKIKALYKYMQENTRYVAISLGIGGFQPFDAKTVFNTGYGDCKALSNYMYALLKFIGIKSYPALVASGRYITTIFSDFPNFQQFNHVILCVPLNKDTLWLECTSQQMPFGFLGDFTDDRNVLLLTENGGKFAHTKKYEPKDNLRTCTSHFDIDSDGTANCSLNECYQGLQYDEIYELLYSKYEEQKKWLYKKSLLPSLQITGFSISNNKKTLPSATISESLISRNYGSFTGNYMLLPINLVNVQRPIKKMLKPRYSDVIIERSSIDYDTLVYKIPNNYKIEVIPHGKTISSNFGNYSYFVSATENEITFIRSFGINQGRYKPSQYKNLYDFILSVSKADNIKVMLAKKS